MANSYKVLGQQRPAASTETDLYTVPASTQTVISSIFASNNNVSSDAVITISIVPGGVATSDEHKLVDTRTLVPDETLTVKGLTLDATDVIRVETDTLGVVFMAFGQEIS